MKRVFACFALLVWSGTGRAAAAQRSAAALNCYRFDNAYFVAAGRLADGSIGETRAAMIRLGDDSAPAPASVPHAYQMAPVEAIPFVVDPTHHYAYLSRSGWRAIPGDSIRLQWLNGFYGPMFRLAVRGDSLVGTFVQTTDALVIGEPPPKARPASAVRVACPAGTQ